jgi:hypothetical protein
MAGLACRADVYDAVGNWWTAQDDVAGLVFQAVLFDNLTILNAIWGQLTD